jgi:hypothetical protein
MELSTKRKFTNCLIISTTEIPNATAFLNPEIIAQYNLFLRQFIAYI